MRFVSLALCWALLLIFGAVAGYCRGMEQAAPPSDYLPIYNFNHDWLVYSEKYENFVPFSKDLDNDIRSVSVYVDLVKNRKYFLLLQSEKQDYLFIEGALQKKLLPKEWLRLNIDSLYQKYRKDELLITLYGSTGVAGKTLLICNKKRPEYELQMPGGASSIINIKPIFASPIHNFLVIVALLVTFICGILFNLNQGYFTRLINPYDFFSYSDRDPLSKVNKPYNTFSILYVLVLSMVMSFVFIMLNNSHHQLIMLGSLLSDGSTLGELIGDFAFLTFSCFIVLFLKYFLMVLVGNMLNLDKLVDTLFLKIIQSSFLFHSLFFLIFWVLSLHFPGWGEYLEPYMHIPFLAFYFVRFVALYLIANPAGKFINLYLFSYLCVVEVIPLIIGIKFAL
ncbi:DUF4271 domain-containing protein [Dyadobacter tibetensis]|uniref:DUF4271 domain-containing protein n=1 Tax=Dyadobacter tibetensis TaxID=1211851 RepID=UPI0004705B67|nr:DUF4271 domain-containing protein [Dyadobacter tibetensis]